MLFSFSSLFEVTLTFLPPRRYPDAKAFALLLKSKAPDTPLASPAGPEPVTKELTVVLSAALISTVSFAAARSPSFFALTVLPKNP